MTAAAQSEDKKKLIRPAEDWRTLVLACMWANDFNRFSKDVVERVGEASSVDALNRWLALAMTIWNATPQPDRGGRTAYELTTEIWEQHREQAP